MKETLPSCAELASHPDPPPNSANLAQRLGAGTSGLGGRRQSAGAAPAAQRASRRRGGSCHLFAWPPRAPRALRRSRGAESSAPQSQRPQLPILSCHPVAFSTSSAATAAAAAIWRFPGLPATLPPQAGGGSWAQQPTAQPADAAARPWGPAPEHPWACTRCAGGGREEPGGEFLIPRPTQELVLKKISRWPAVEQPPLQSSMWTGSLGPLSALWLPPPSEQPLPAAGAPRGARSGDARLPSPLPTAGRFFSGGGSYCCC